MDSINWAVLFDRFLLPAEKSESESEGESYLQSRLPLDQFTFLVKDLLSIRNQSEVSLEEAVRCAKEVLARPHWSCGVDKALTLTVGAVVDAIKAGVFEEDGINASYFVDMTIPVLEFNDSFEDNDEEQFDCMPPPPLLQRNSSAQVLEEQQWRTTVGIASNSIQEKEIRKLVCSITQESQDDRPPLLGQRGGGSRENSVATAVSEPPHGVCSVCFDEVPTAEMWGSGCMPKQCDCSLMVCLACLTMSSRADIQNGIKPICPQMLSLSPPRRCAVPLDPSLLAQLLKDQCPLCDVTVHATSLPVPCGEVQDDEMTPLMDVGCALETFHKFCTTCLRLHVTEALNQSHTMPRCLRSAECKFTLDETAIRAILLTNKTLSEQDVDDMVERWQEIRLETLEGTWRGNKKCPTPDCTGFLRASLEQVRMTEREDQLLDVQCTNCHKSYCWRCREKCHPTRSCTAYRLADARWKQFLLKFGSPSERTRLENVAADRKYFRDNLQRGDMKRCPKCSRLIQKMKGCNDMWCGRNYDGKDRNQQSGCGHKFRWSDVPKMSVHDLNHESQTLDMDINATDLHFDTLKLNETAIIEPIVCHGCDGAIFGAKFECLSCKPNDSATSSKCFLCLQCVLKNLPGDELPTASGGNVTKCFLGHAMIDISHDNADSNTICSRCGHQSTGSTFFLCLLCNSTACGPCTKQFMAKSTPHFHSSAGLSLPDLSSAGAIKNKVSPHMGHVFDIINPPSTQPVVTVMFASVLTTGDVLVYNVPSMLTPLNNEISACQGGGSNSARGRERTNWFNDEADRFSTAQPSFYNPFSITAIAPKQVRDKFIMSPSSIIIIVLLIFLVLTFC
jgi:hypothetical protein